MAFLHNSEGIIKDIVFNGVANNTLQLIFIFELETNYQEKAIGMSTNIKGMSINFDLKNRNSISGIIERLEENERNLNYIYKRFKDKNIKFSQLIGKKVKLTQDGYDVVGDFELIEE